MTASDVLLYVATLICYFGYKWANFVKEKHGH